MDGGSSVCDCTETHHVELCVLQLCLLQVQVKTSKLASPYSKQASLDPTTDVIHESAIEKQEQHHCHHCRIIT